MGRDLLSCGGLAGSPFSANQLLGTRLDAPRTGSEAAAGADALLDRLTHLYALNRGILLTPFHNMALMSPVTTEVDVDRHTDVFAELARELTG